MAEIKGLAGELKRIANLSKGSGSNEYGDGGVPIPLLLRIQMIEDFYGRIPADIKNGKPMSPFIPSYE